MCGIYRADAFALETKIAFSYAYYIMIYAICNFFNPSKKIPDKRQMKAIDLRKVRKSSENVHITKIGFKNGMKNP